ncbi:transmembrane protein [Thalictrum thalictroides]|uniref:Transmembrane protein n=1 Tax=Thalictrum thalictroides TaxID=46969 RepID=A0A7J6VDY0_THATH|nr:transmembrane protein [Thalictrum thalictroides]
MEEETSEEWEIVENEKQGSGKMSLLYRVGKKIVITGAVISSAPFVLPPLIVISCIGFAFAVPFGFAYASYACTDKIMSKLLSIPSNDVERFEGLEEEGKDREEEEFEEDLKKNLEMRIELVGDEIETEEKGGFEDQGIVEMGYEEEGESEELDESEKGNQLDAEEEEEKKMVREDKNVEEREIPVEVAFYTIEEEGEGEPIKGTVIESIEKEEVPYAGVIQAVKENSYEKEYIPQEGVTFENIKEEDGLMREKEGTGEKKTMEDYSSEEARQKEEVPFAGVMKALEEYGSKENGVVHEKLEPNAIVEKEKPVFETNETINERRIGELNEDNMMEKKPVTTEKEMNIWKNENAREIADESGLLLFEEETVTSEQYIPETYEIREVTFEVDSLPQTLSSPSSFAMEDKNVGTVVHTVSTEMAETIPATVSSKEVLYSEEKMWELIVAMRKIVGYKAAIQPSFAEELKALYIFTGVEPPVPFKDQLDLVEVNDKIRLLMAIIGVKI